MGLRLGIDAGTYSSKGGATDGAGPLPLQRTIHHVMATREPGWAEQDADGVWWRDVLALNHALLSHGTISGADLAVVAISGLARHRAAHGEPLPPTDRSARAYLALYEATRPFVHRVVGRAVRSTP